MFKLVGVDGDLVVVVFDLEVYLYVWDVIDGCGDYCVGIELVVDFLLDELCEVWIGVWFVVFVFFFVWVDFDVFVLYEIE